ncbi:MAG: NADH-quinone oxidoreductase subunit I [Planctomycetota bacterium]
MVLVKQRTLSFGERFYFKSVISGLIYTFKNLFKKKITRCYPEVKLVPTPALHGVPVLVMNEEGHPRCVACGLCEYVCPPHAIEIHGTETDRPIERMPKTFTIDYLRCIECGYCEEACPEEAIVMSQDYELVGASRTAMVADLNRLLTPASKLQPRLEYIRKTYRRFQTDPKEEANASTVPGRGGPGAGVAGRAVPAARRRYRENY